MLDLARTIPVAQLVAGVVLAALTQLVVKCLLIDALEYNKILLRMF